MTSINADDDDGEDGAKINNKSIVDVQQQRQRQQQSSSSSSSPTDSAVITTKTRMTTKRRITTMLANACPDNAPYSWMIINTLCLICSLYLGIYNLAAHHITTNATTSSSNGQGKQQQEQYDYEGYYQDDDNDNGDQQDIVIEDQQIVRATVEYLVWSLVTTIVWIIEVSLRAAFPSGTTTVTTNNICDKSIEDRNFMTTCHGNNDKITSVNFLRDCIEHTLIKMEQQQQQKQQEEGEYVQEIEITSSGNEQQQQPSQQQQQEKQNQHRATATTIELRILFIELLLAIFFFIESILDCYQWKMRIQEDDFVQQEVDVWINILAYSYMTYETYKTITTRLEDIHHLPITTNTRTASSSMSSINMTPILQDPYEPTVPTSKII